MKPQKNTTHSKFFFALLIALLMFLGLKMEDGFIIMASLILAIGFTVWLLGREG